MRPCRTAEVRGRKATAGYGVTLHRPDRERVSNLLEMRLARVLLPESRFARPRLLEMRLARANLPESRFARLAKRKVSRIALARRKTDRASLAKRKNAKSLAAGP